MIGVELPQGMLTGTVVVAAGLLGLWLLGNAMRSNKMPVAGKTVLITGGSQGMGLSLGRLLAQKGANVIIVARDLARLKQAITVIKTAAESTDQRFHYISGDLTEVAESTRIMQQASEWNDGRPPDILINCAGASHPGYFLDLDPLVMRKQMDTNFFSSMYMAHAACRLWVSHAVSSKDTAPKHLIFTSSLIAFLPLAGYNSYCPSKTALRALSDGLQQELQLYETVCPIRTHCVFPGTIFTAGLDAENVLKPGITKQFEESDPGQTADEVAQATLKALEAGHSNIITNGLLGRAMQAGMLGAGRRAGIGLCDLMLSWVVGLILVATRFSMDRQVRLWGRQKHDMQWPSEEAFM